MYWYLFGGVDSDTDLATVYRKDTDDDVLTDIDGFTVTSSKNQHLISLLF